MANDLGLTKGGKPRKRRAPTRVVMRVDRLAKCDTVPPAKPKKRSARHDP